MGPFATALAALAARRALDGEDAAEPEHSAPAVAVGRRSGQSEQAGSVAEALAEASAWGAPAAVLAAQPLAVGRHAAEVEPAAQAAAAEAVRAQAQAGVAPAAAQAGVRSAAVLQGEAAARPEAGPDGVAEPREAVRAEAPQVAARTDVKAAVAAEQAVAVAPAAVRPVWQVEPHAAGASALFRPLAGRLGQARYARFGHAAAERRRRQQEARHSRAAAISRTSCSNSSRERIAAEAGHVRRRIGRAGY